MGIGCDKLRPLESDESGRRKFGRRARERLFNHIPQRQKVSAGPRERHTPLIVLPLARRKAVKAKGGALSCVCASYKEYLCNTLLGYHPFQKYVVWRRGIKVWSFIDTEPLMVPGYHSSRAG